MSIPALRWARKVRHLTGTQKLVLLVLADAANDHGECWPSAVSISEDCCLSDRATRSALDALEELGLIRGDRCGGRATRWTLDVGKTPEPRLRRSAQGSRVAARGAAIAARRAGVSEAGAGVALGEKLASPSGVSRHEVQWGAERHSDITLKNPVPPSSLRSDGGARAAPPPHPQPHEPAAVPKPPPSVAPLLLDVRTVLWTEGLTRLRRLTGKGDRAARSMLGRLLALTGDDCALLSAVLVQAEADRPGDPIAWITATIDVRMGRRRPLAAQGRQAEPRWGWPSIFDAPAEEGVVDGYAEEAGGG